MNYKTHVLLLISILLISIFGFYLLAHGAVYLESALRSGEPTFWLKIEVILGSILIWPVSAFGWIFHLLFNKIVNIPFPITVILLISGYYALFFSISRLIKNHMHKKLTPTASD